MKFLYVIFAAAIVGGSIGAAMAYMSVGPAIAAPNDALPAADADGSLAPSPRPRPLIRIDEPEFDFGFMQRGATKSHTFKVHNDGDAPLTITPGQPSCRCTKFEAADRIIPPGGVGDVTLEWAATVSPGPFRQTAPLSTNDHGVVLSVSGEVIDASGLEPREFVLGRIGADEQRELSVVFMSYETDDLEVTAEPPDREGTEDAYDVSVSPLAQNELPDERAKTGVRVDLAAGPGLPIGIVTDWVTLHTNLETAETLKVPVIGRVEGDLSIRGADWSADSGVLALGFVKSSVGRKSKMFISVKGPDATNAKIEVAELDPPELKATLGEPRARPDGVVHVPLEVEVPRGTRPMVRLNTGRKPDGTHQFPEGVIRLTSTLPSTPEIQLRVRFAVEDDSR